MNAPAFLPLPEPAALRDALGDVLYGAAMAGHVALSDAPGCDAVMLRAHPGIGQRTRASGRRIAIDLVQCTARRPDTDLARAARRAVAIAEAIASGRDGDPHAALARIADLLDGALSRHTD